MPCTATHHVTRAALVSLLLLATIALPASIAQAQSETDDQLFARLEGTRVDALYAPEDFSKVIDDLRGRYDLNLQVAWGLLGEMDIRKDNRVEIRLKNVPISVLLDNLVRELDPRGVAELAWGVEQGIVQFTVREALARNTVLRLYDVRNLLESGYAYRRFANTPVLGLELTGRELLGGEVVLASTAGKAMAGGGGFGGGGGGGDGGGSIFGSPGEDPDRTTRMERAQEIVDLVQSQVEPETWLDMGGNTGDIRVMNGNLVVRHTPRAQRAVADLLDSLRRTAPMPLRLEAALVRLPLDRAAALRQDAADSFPRLPASAFDRLVLPGAATLLFRGSTAGANGEAFWLSDVSQVQAIQAVSGVVGDQSAVTLPQLASIDDGLELVVLPLVTPGEDVEGGPLKLDVQMAIKDPVELQARETPAGPIDQSRERMRTVSSTAYLRLGDAIALSVPVRPSADGSAVEYEEWLLLLVRGAGR